MKLVDDWNKAWKWISMQGMVTAGVIQSVWITLPDDWRSSLNTHWISGLTIVCLVIGVFGRLYKQNI